MKIEYAARSHRGRVRENNEDNLFVNGTILPAGLDGALFSLDGHAEDQAVFAVCDGMGGESDGETASRLAVETLLACQGQLQDVKPSGLAQAVQRYVTQASQSILLKTAIGKRSGTTLALAVAARREVFCFNVGDSRIYDIRDGQLRQVTRDHTANQHKLTRCLGIGPPPQAEGYPALPGNGRLLICSDGLSNMLFDEEIRVALQTAPRPAQAADLLLHTVLQRGARDNVTVIVLDTRTSGWPRMPWASFPKRRNKI